MIVRMKQDDERMSLRKGDVLEVVPYPLDPAEKFTVLRRLSDDFDPECNVYRHQVEVIQSRSDAGKKTRRRSRG